jgi:NAD(P)-dependent dehydrogenase (short-subunit alcohol dehydrogenase family)
MEDALGGRVAIVTGAGSGIGRASALAFARAGASVAVVDTNGDTGRETVALIETEVPGAAQYFACDVSDEAEVAALVSSVTSAFGRLDAAHNNAGISPMTGGVAECSREVWDRILAVNLTGVFLGMKHQIPAMLQTAGRGAIVNTSSGAGIQGVAGLPAYVASKHGVAGLTKSAALEYATRGVRVNAVCPGTTLTELLREKVDAGFYSVEGMAAGCPMKRLADPSEIAAAVVWLCSDSASFVNGVVMPVDGATTAGPASLG